MYASHHSNVEGGNTIDINGLNLDVDGLRSLPVAVG
jgi:hypothetical protein